MSGRWRLISLSYFAAAIAFIVAYPPTELISGHFFLALAPSAFPMAIIAMMAWLIIAVVAAWRFRLQAWPIAIGAPLALALPAEIGVLLWFCAAKGQCI